MYSCVRERGSAVIYGIIFLNPNAAAPQSKPCSSQHNGSLGVSLYFLDAIHCCCLYIASTGCSLHSVPQTQHARDKWSPELISAHHTGCIIIAHRYLEGMAGYVRQTMALYFNQGVNLKQLTELQAEGNPEVSCCCPKACYF